MLIGRGRFLSCFHMGMMHHSRTQCIASNMLLLRGNERRERGRFFLRFTIIRERGCFPLYSLELTFAYAF